MACKTFERSAIPLAAAPSLLPLHHLVMGVDAITGYPARVTCCRGMELSPATEGRAACPVSGRHGPRRKGRWIRIRLL